MDRSDGVRDDAGTSHQRPHGGHTSQHSAALSNLAGLNLGEAMKTRGFWLLAAAIFIQALGAGVVLVHFVPIITDKGFSSGFASYILGFVLLFSTMARVGFGYIGDKYSPRRLLVVVFCLIAMGILILLLGKSRELLFLTPIFIGFGVGGIVVLLTLSVAEVFGMKAFGTLLGVFNMVLIFGVGIGPAIAGFIYDVTGEYTTVLSLAIILILVSAITLIFVPPLNPRTSNELELLEEPLVSR
jgi:MFS family permease